MKELINKDGSINPQDWFTFPKGKNKDKKLKIIGTRSDGYGVMECTDTIKNLENNKYTELKRSVLVQLKPIYQE